MLALFVVGFLVLRKNDIYILLLNSILSLSLVFILVENNMNLSKLELNLN